MGQTVFISYSSKEAAQAKQTRHILEENGIDCWIAPESIPAGSDYGTEIEDAICGCRVFLLILSRSAQESIWITKEISIAISNGKTVIPFHIDASELVKPFSFHLTNVQRIEAYDDLSAAYRELVKRIRETAGEPVGGEKGKWVGNDIGEVSGAGAVTGGSSADSITQASGYSEEKAVKAKRADPLEKGRGLFRSVSDFVTKPEKERKQASSFIRMLTEDTEAYRSRITEGEAEKTLYRLCETVRYSDPVSTESVVGIEEKIAALNDRLSDAVNKRDSDVIISVAQDMEQLVKDRNRRLRSVK